jgi:uncharacterized metal-binding protein
MAYPSNLPDDPAELEGIEKPSEAAPATLENIMIFATRYNEIEAEIESILAYCATLKEEAKEIEEVKLPGVLQALGMSDFGLTDGSKVKIDPAFQGSVAIKDPEQRKKQIDWLVKNDGQDLVRNEISISFGRGQDAEAKAVCDILNEYHITYEIGESVHSGSLGAFIKEKMANGEDVPLDVLKWRYFFKASIKKPVAKKKKVKE